jgi:hypothetical protein
MRRGFVGWTPAIEKRGTAVASYTFILWRVLPTGRLLRLLFREWDA